MPEDSKPPVPEFTDREPLPSSLIPAERVALTVARRQLERGDNPPVNITTVLVMTIDRLLSEQRQPPEGTVTQWAIRVADPDSIPTAEAMPVASEEVARAAVPAWRRGGWAEVAVVSRQVGPWTDVPETVKREDDAS